jgi:hypothetical protein
LIFYVIYFRFGVEYIIIWIIYMNDWFYVGTKTLF